MFCHKCGNKNPDNANFCWSCGNKLTPIELGADSTARVEPMVPSAQANTSNANDAAYKRPDMARPITENPAQPQRPKVERPAAMKPPPAANVYAGDSGDDHGEEELPEQKPKVLPRRAQTDSSKAVTASGSQMKPPARTPNVKKPGSGYGEVSHRKASPSPFAQAQERLSNAIPGNKMKGTSDLFFEDVDEPEDFEFEEEDRMSKHLKSIIAVLFIVLVLSAMGWLFGSQSGQVFRASMGIGAPAEAYKTLGDQKFAGEDFKGAAEAYYDALRLDPNNYAYALLVGRTYERVGDDETAIKAYHKCIELRDKSSEPYRLLAEVYEKQGNMQMGQQTRQQGYEKTGDGALLEDAPASASRLADPNDIVDAMPNP